MAGEALSGEDKSSRHATAMPPPRHRHATAMPPPCHLHATSMPPPRHLHATSMPPPCHLHATAMPPPCHRHATAMPPPCHRHATAVPPPCHCHATAIHFHTTVTLPLFHRGVRLGGARHLRAERGRRFGHPRRSDGRDASRARPSEAGQRRTSQPHSTTSLLSLSVTATRGMHSQVTGDLAEAVKLFSEALSLLLLTQGGSSILVQPPPFSRPSRRPIAAAVIQPPRSGWASARRRLTVTATSPCDRCHVIAV